MKNRKEISIFNLRILKNIQKIFLSSLLILIFSSGIIQLGQSSMIYSSSLKINNSFISSSIEHSNFISSDLISNLDGDLVSEKNILLNNDGNSIFFDYKQKIGVDLWSKLLSFRKTDNNISSEKLLVVFSNNLAKEGRVSIVSSYFDNITLRYNYDLIPAISIIVNSRDFESSLLRLVSNHLVKFISLNHGYQLPNIENDGFILSSFQERDQYSSILSENTNLNVDENWSSPISMDNWWLERIGATNVSYTGKNVKLAIIDTGISVHPDFFVNGKASMPRIIASRNFAYRGDVPDPDYVYDEYGHGTHVAGIAGGNGYLSNGYYRGVAPDVNIINAKTSNSSGYLEEDDIIAAIDWSVNLGADIISMSFGGGFPTSWSVESIAIRSAVKKGVVAVASAGNSGPELFTSGSPASDPYTISVGASDINNHVISFSSVGPTTSYQQIPDIVAPGVHIIAPESLGSVISLEKRYTDEVIDESDDFAYIELSGTSMSCPIVSGSVALLLEAFPNASPETIRSALIQSATPLKRVSSEGYGFAQGAGLINIPAAIEFLKSIKNSTNSVNHLVYSAQRVVPYSPYDLIKFPGDSTFLNLSIMVGEKMTYRIEFPTIEGIEFSAYNQTLFNVSSSSVEDFPFFIKIKENVLPGDKNGYIKIIDANTGSIIDEIFVNISVAYPRGKILFDSYHGLNDFYPGVATTPYQSEFYHMMQDLVEWNYSISFKMENWTYGYNPYTDAQVITSSLLSDIDLLVLQSPIIPYSEFEISAIKDYYNNGGSILFLGSLNNKICTSSINNLFSALNSGIIIGNENLFNKVDYGVFASYTPFELNESNFNNSTGYFNSVEKIFFGFGTSFDIINSSSAVGVAEINNLTVVAESVSQNINDNQGKLLAISDFHPFVDSYYNDPNLYGNHSQFLQNLVGTLIPDRDYKVSIIINNRSETDSKVAFSVISYNPLTQKIVNLNYVNISLDSATFNSSIILDSNLTLNSVYSKQIDLNESMISTSEIKLEILYSVNSGEKKSYKNFYYFPYLFNGYNNITSFDEEFYRDPDNILNITLNETARNANYNLYTSIRSDTYLSGNLMELNKSFVGSSNFNNTTISISYSKIESAGQMWMFAESIDSDGYRDLSPDRFSINIWNHPPVIDKSKSIFGGISLDKVIQDDSLVPLTGKLGVIYSFKILVGESVAYEDSASDLSVSGTLIPIYVYNGYIQILYPLDFPLYDFVYNPETKQFQSNISIPESLNYSHFNSIVNRSLETDLVKYFSLIWVTVRDNDGGSTSVYILLDLFKEPPDTSNYSPVWGLFAILAACAIILQKWPQIVSKFN